MNRRIQPLSLILFGIDLLIVLLGLFVASELRLRIPLGATLSEARARIPWPVYLLALGTWGVALVSSGAYDPKRALRWYNEAARVAWASILATMLMAGLLYISFRQVSRLQFLYFFFVSLLSMLGVRAAFRLYYRVVGRRRPGGRSRVLIVGAGELGQRVGHILLDRSRWGYDIVGYADDDEQKQGRQFDGLPVLGAIADLRNLVRDHKVEEVWVALPARAYQRLDEMVLELEREPVRLKVIPDYFSLALIQAKPEIMGGILVIGLREPVIEGVSRLTKRAFDLIVSGVLLIFAAPVMLLIMLLIRLESQGPVLFRQKRIGENGRLFEMLKFRSMVVEADTPEASGPRQDNTEEVIHKRKDDPRVTRVGRLLRRYSLDELPQLLNVLKGDMSLVGPRPEMPWLVERYESWQRKRFAVPQGITGWWQINGRSDKPMHLNTEDDLYYVYNYSLWLDIKIVIRTPVAVLRGQGAF